MKQIEKNTSAYIQEIRQILASARQKAYSAVNFAMVEAYWLIGKRIVEEEQNGKSRAEYGEHVITEVSKALTEEFGKGFSKTNVKNFRTFYLIFNNFQISQALPDQSITEIQQVLPGQYSSPNSASSARTKILPVLSWTHYERLMRVKDPIAREWYMNEAAKQMWGYRTLDRNISSLYYHRLLSSQIKEPVIREMEEKTKELQRGKLEFIKNPSILEFLGLPSNTGYSESQLEQAIIDQMQKFLLELGKGFAFVDRQQHIRTETSDFYIDLVFYNYILKCFVIIELKTKKTRIRTLVSWICTCECMTI